MILLHPLVLGELAMGNLVDWDDTISTLTQIPRPRFATFEEVLALVRQERLMGSGLGWIDAALLASARLTGARLWSRDRRLADAAERLHMGLRD
jgi:predicted nucleic acid-binding protein